MAIWATRWLTNNNIKVTEQSMKRIMGCSREKLWSISIMVAAGPRFWKQLERYPGSQIMPGVIKVDERHSASG